MWHWETLTQSVFSNYFFLYTTEETTYKVAPKSVSFDLVLYPAVRKHLKIFFYPSEKISSIFSSLWFPQRMYISINF